MEDGMSCKISSKRRVFAPAKIAGEGKNHLPNREFSGANYVSLREGTGVEAN